MHSILFSLLLFTLTPVQEKTISIDDINAPDGFNVAVYAEVPNARSMALSPSGVVYVGNRQGKNVYAVVDEDGDQVAEKRYVIDEELTMPNGVAFKDGDLYVGALNQILRYRDIESNLKSPPDPEVIYDELPSERHHGWKYIGFGPDGKLYVPVGTPCNVCKSDDPVFATIMRMDPDGSNLEIFAEGVRNSVGFTWHPDTGELWFTDNGRDMLGDDIPPCELNRAEKQGMHFGYPYCHGGTIKDPEFGDEAPCSKFVAPAHAFGAHVAPLGLQFYTGSQYPSEYHGDLFVAQHGSWNRSKKVGYRVVKLEVSNGNVTNQTVFLDGWLNDESQKAWGRPVDVIQLLDGSLLVSDDYADVIYRVSYEGS